MRECFQCLRRQQGRSQNITVCDLRHEKMPDSLIAFGRFLLSPQDRKRVAFSLKHRADAPGIKRLKRTGKVAGDVSQNQTDAETSARGTTPCRDPGTVVVPVAESEDLFSLSSADLIGRCRVQRPGNGGNIHPCQTGDLLDGHAFCHKYIYPPERILQNPYSLFNVASFTE